MMRQHLRPRRRHAVLLLGLLACTWRAQAQDVTAPRLEPSRDVAVIYRLAGGDMGDAAQKVQATYVDGARRVRLDFFRWVESKYPFMSSIYDAIAGRVIMVFPERRQYAELPFPPARIPGQFLSKDMTFTRAGTATVAGLACTNWRIKSPDPAKDASTVCVTDDGVLLRLTGKGASGEPDMNATAVQYGAPPSGIFAPPEGFTKGARPAP